MARGKKAAWSLDPKQVHMFGTGSRSSTRRRASLPRSLDVSGSGLRLVHSPTGVEVSGEIPAEIPAGHYSKARLKELRAELHARLFAELERRVARHLRVPGR